MFSKYSVNGGVESILTVYCSFVVVDMLVIVWEHSNSLLFAHT